MRLWTSRAGAREVDARLALVDLGRVGDAFGRLRRGLESAALKIAQAHAPSVPRRGARARREARPPSCRGRSARRSVAQTGPVSSPSSMRMTMTAVSVSPAMMARWMGAAPRQRGRLRGVQIEAAETRRIEHGRGAG